VNWRIALDRRVFLLAAGLETSVSALMWIGRLSIRLRICDGLGLKALLIITKLYNFLVSPQEQIETWLVTGFTPLFLWCTWDCGSCLNFIGIWHLAPFLQSLAVSAFMALTHSEIRPRNHQNDSAWGFTERFKCIGGIYWFSVLDSLVFK